MQCEAGRRRSQVHEARWLNLLGFALRPGYGLAVDDWRVAETWRIVQGKLVHPAAACRMEGWILWRRVGGGLLAGQQQAIAEPLLGPVRGLHRLLMSGKGRGGDFAFPSHETAEIWRLLGSLELLPPELKTELGKILVDLLPKRKMEPMQAAMVWALGRLGARDAVVRPVECRRAGRRGRQVARRPVGSLVGRSEQRVGGDADGPADRGSLPRRAGKGPRRRPPDWLQRQDAPAHFVELVERGGLLDSEEQGLVFGESLPKGLRLG